MIATAAAAADQQRQSGPRCVALKVATRLDKYIPLPPRPHFKVNDVLQRGEVYSFIRSKHAFFLPDHISKLKSRCINVTASGFLVIYEDNENGLVVDLRRVLNVICHADRFIEKRKKLNYFRCHIKIRLPHGNVHLFVRDEDVHKWTCAIMRASAKPGKCQKFQTKLAAKEEDILMTAIEEEDEFEEITSATMMTPTTCETCKEEEDYDVDYDADETETTVVEQPVQNPTTTSVRSLRSKLEKDLIMKPKEQVLAEQQLKKRPQFVSELFCPPPIFNDDTIVLEPTSDSERREQEKEVEREQKWWTRSLRC